VTGRSTVDVGTETYLAPRTCRTRALAEVEASQSPRRERPATLYVCLCRSVTEADSLLL
jgi:hypothetical protein